MCFRALIVYVALAVLSAEDKPLLRLNEILYDPPGPDTGAEFVELFYPGAVPLPLDGFELWFLNGAAQEGDPRVVWRASTGDALAPGGFRVIGGAAVAERDETVELGLQNGPDALWLVHGGVRVDAVAWGEGASAFGEGPAAPLAASTSLGRVPDGADTNDNAADFRVLPTASPGRENLRAEAIEPLAVEFDPVWRADAGRVVARVVWTAEGWAARQAARVSIGAEELDLVLDRGDSLVVERVVMLEPGRSLLAATGSSRALERAVQVGTSALVLTEVQPRPLSGEPEWIELRNVGTGGVALAEWSWADAQATPRRIGSDRVLHAGERVVLTADPIAWAANYPSAVVPVLRPEGGWSTLNDSDGARGIADAVLLLDPDQVIVDRVAYRAADIAVRGRSLQRTAAIGKGQVVWIGSLGGPTPGAPHPAETQDGRPSALHVDPDPFTPDDDGVGDVLEIVAPRPMGSVRAEVRDLAGVLVRELDGVLADDRGYWQWDGRDARGRGVAAGAYVVLVRSETDEGEVRVWRTVVGLDRRS